MTAVTEEVATVKLTASTAKSIHELHRIRSAVLWYVDRVAEPYKSEGVFNRADMTYPTVSLDSTADGTWITLRGNQDMVAKTLSFFCYQCAEHGKAAQAEPCAHLAPGSKAVIKKSHRDSAEVEVLRYKVGNAPTPASQQGARPADPAADDVARWLIEQLTQEWR
jgi:hypothetical protein